MILQLAADGRIEATEVLLGCERYFILRAEALEGLFLRVEEPAESAVPAARRKKAGPSKAKKARKGESAPGVVMASALAGDYLTVREKVSARLAKGPMTSGDLVAAIGGAAGSVYQALSAMRQAGEIETRVDDTDGERKNFKVA